MDDFIKVHKASASGRETLQGAMEARWAGLIKIKSVDVAFRPREF